MSDKGDHCCCRFDESDNCINRCWVHAEIERERDRLRAELAEREDVISRAASAWLSLSPGVAWEGDLGGAVVAAVAEIERLKGGDHIDIVFDGPPGPVAGRFVEVEDSARRSIRFGEWTKRDDGFWVLRVANEQASAHRSAQIRAACQTALRALDTYEAMYRHHMTVQLYSARAGLREALDGRN